MTRKLGPWGLRDDNTVRFCREERQLPLSTLETLQKKKDIYTLDIFFL